MTPEAIQGALSACKWPYADRDPTASAALQAKVADVGRRQQLITYTDLVRGVTFRLPNVDDGAPFELGVPDWREVDRAILGDFLGRLCVDSYREGRCFASALVTSKETSEPSEGFWNLLEALGVFTSTDSNRRLMFWAGEVAKAHAWYAGVS